VQAQLLSDIRILVDFTWNLRLDSHKNMLNKNNKRVSIAVIFSISMLCVAPMFKTNIVLYLTLMGFGSLLLVVCFMKYIEAKGYSRWLGLLVLIKYIGLIVLVFLPDRCTKVSSQANSKETDAIP